MSRCRRRCGRYRTGVEVQGQYSGGAAAELFTIGDIARVWVYADVADVELPRVRQAEMQYLTAEEVSTRTPAKFWRSVSCWRSPRHYAAKARCLTPRSCGSTPSSPMHGVARSKICGSRMCISLTVPRP